MHHHWAEEQQEFALGAPLRINPAQFAESFREGAIISPRIYGERLRISDTRLAELARVHSTTVLRAPADETLQDYLRGSLSVLTLLVEANGGDMERAIHWYRNVPLTALGGETAECYVSIGKVQAMRRYVSNLAAGASG